MSKTTLAIIAAASAATGASLTALFYSSRSRPHLENVPTPVNTIPSKTTPTTPVPVVPPKLSPVQPVVNPAGILQYGHFGPIADTLITPSHLSSFNRFTRNPHWVAEHFTPESLALNNGNRRNSIFYEDASVPQMFRAKLADYVRSGYDRGHQVPAADCKWSQEAMDSTFVLTNMCPQVGEGFNRDYWAHFEEFCRNLVRRYPSVRVVTGPLYLPKKEADGKWRVSYEVLGNPPNVAVPTHFYKIIYGEEAANSPIGSVALAAFVLPNAQIPTDKSLADFEVPLDAVERASGLTFADKLPVERRKQLCQEVKCDTIVREFDNARKHGNQLTTGQKSVTQPTLQPRKW